MNASHTIVWSVKCCWESRVSYLPTERVAHWAMLQSSRVFCPASMTSPWISLTAVRRRPGCLQGRHWDRKAGDRCEGCSLFCNSRSHSCCFTSFTLSDIRAGTLTLTPDVITHDTHTPGERQLNWEETYCSFWQRESGCSSLACIVSTKGVRTNNTLLFMHDL